MIATLAVLAACSGDNLVAPDEPEVNEYSDLQALEGNVSWFCWIDGGTGEVHSCEFWCEGEGEELTLDDDGYYVCAGPSEPEPEDPPGPGTPGSPEADTAQIILTCDKDVVRGTDGGCTLSYPSWTPISNIQWASLVPDANPQQTGGNSWKGDIVTDTQVMVNYDLSGAAGPTKSGLVTVKGRAWAADWSTAWKYHKGAAPDCHTDRHYVASVMGWIIGLSCSKSSTMFNPDPNVQSNYSVQEVNDGGPNDGAWFLTAPPLRMDLMSQILPDLRGAHQYAVGSGSPSAVRNNCPSQVTLVQVNSCATTSPNDFGTMVGNVWAHERVHYDSATVAAGRPKNDLWRKLEGETAGSEADLLFKLVKTTSDINNDIFNVSLKAENGSHGPYNFYAYVAGSLGTWQWVSWILQGVL